MKSRSLYLILFIMILSVTSVYGQKGDVRKADVLFEKGEYYRALEIYRLAESTGTKFDLETRKKVARCYYELNNIDKAFDLYTEMADDLTGNDVFIYAKVSHRVGFYPGAIELYESAIKQGGNPIVINELIKSCQWAMENEQFMPYRVNPSTLLTFGQSFGIQYYKNGVVYSSAFEAKAGKNLDKQGKSFLNLFYSDIVDGEIQSNKRLFSENLVFPFHVGAISFTSDFNTMYFTKSVLVKGGRDVLKIYAVQFDGKQWGKEVELSFNSNDYDCAHPAVSPDDKFLYFVSNKKSGGFGGKDIYVIEIKRNNTFGEMKNLGPDVNTFGDEVFPVVSKDNVLYFSSDGHYGFGGLDIFSAENINGKWTNVKNLLQPFNSIYDEFGYVIDPKNKEFGFLSSNRTGDRSDVIFYVRPAVETQTTEVKDDETALKVGLDALKKDIPAEEEVKSVTEVPIVETVVQQDTPKKILPNSISSVLTSTFNGTAIGGAKIIVRDANSGKVVGEVISDASGRFNLTIPEQYLTEDAEFEIEVSKGNEFKPKKVIANIQEFEELKKSGISLTPIFNDVVLDDIGGMVIPYVENEITKEGYNILDKLAAYLLSNPNIVIKLNGHTEARGNRYINLTISQQVAEKAEMYLISKGVPDENLIPRGYAERYLLNKCKRGKYCTEQEHLENRRVEVVVWRMR